MSMTPIKVELQLDSGRFQTDLKSAIAALQGIQGGANKAGSSLGKVKDASDRAATSLQRTTRASQSLLGVWRDIAIVGNVFARAVAQVTNASHGWLGEIVRVNAEMERLNFQMRAMSTADDPIKDAAQSVAWLRKEATQAPFSLKAITNSFVKLKAARLDPQGGTLRSFLDGLAAFGAGDEQLHRVSIAITQMAGKSVIQMEELRQQLGEHMPTAMRLMARSMGMTVAELTKVVSTGTLDARDSLEKLSKEMNRTYGGAAIRMMQTFSGQITQMKANIQLLMTDSGGQAFFNVIKEQLLDINDFLSSNKAKVYAKQFGEGLATIALTIKDVVSWFWKWRDVIVTVGTTLAGMYAIKKITDLARGLSMALAGGVGNLRSSLVGAASSIATLGAGLNGLRTGQHVMTSLGVAAIGLRGAFTALTASIPLIGIGLLGLQAVVALFANWESAADKAAKKTREAFEAAKEGAAPSYEAAKKAIDDQKRLLEDRIEQLRNNVENKPISQHMIMSFGIAGVGGSAVDAQKKISEKSKEELEKAQQELKELLEKSPIWLDAQKEADVAMGRRAAERRLALSTEMETANKTYNDRHNQLDTLREKEIQNAIDTGGSIQKVTDKYNRLSIDEQKKLYNTRIRIANDERKAIEKARAEDWAREKAGQERLFGDHIYAGQLEANREYVEETKKAFDNLDPTKLIPNTLAAAVDSNNAKLARGGKTLVKMQQALADTKAETIGMGNAYATMIAKIQNGSFGSLEGLYGAGLKAAQDLHKQLRDMAAEQTIFDKMREGYKSLSNDMEQSNRKRSNERIRLAIKEEGRKRGYSLTEDEKIKLRIDKGDYFGIGSAEEIREQLRQTIEVMNTQGQLAHHLGEVLRDNTFSEATNESILTTADSVETVNEKLEKTASILGGISFGAFSGLTNELSVGLTGISAGFENSPAPKNLPKNIEDRMAQAMQHLMSKGWSQVASAGMVGNLVAESGLDTTILGDNGTSVGIAQWHNERMVAMKRWITAQGRDWKDLHAQLDFLDYELRTSEATTGNQLRLARDSNAAAEIFMNGFERPSERAKRESRGKRYGAAQRSYDIADNGDFIKQSGLPKGATINSKGQASVPIEFVPIDVNSGRIREIQEKITETWEKAEDVVKKALTDGSNDEMSLRLDTAVSDAKDATQAIMDEWQQIKDLGINASEAQIRLWRAAKEAGVDFSNERIAAAYKELVMAEKKVEALKTNEKQLIELEKQQKSANERIAEYNKLAANPNWQGASEEIKKIRQEFEPLLRDLKEHFGQDSSEYQNMFANMQTALTIQANVELAQLEAKTAREEQILKRSVMTKSQIRAEELRNRLQDVEEEGRRLAKAASNEIAVAEWVEREKKRIKEQAEREANPVLNQMHEWQDIQANLEKAATGWMESLADGIAGLITGTGDLRGAIQGIINDIAKMGVKWLLSGLFGGTGAGGENAIKSLFKKSAGSMHTGGIAGDGGMVRSMSALAWAGAPKFHSGGLVGGMLPSEVPIIAKKGEGVFTPEQMKAMGGFQQNQVVQINSPITVNGSAGSPEQNNDLAKQMAREMDSTMRAIIVDEMRKQTRPGSMMNTRAR